MLSSYEMLAKYYNHLQREIDYSKWIELSHPFLKQKVLEIGCGTGTFANQMKFENYIGFDISPNMIKQAKKNYPNLSFYVDDAITFQVKEKFDHIICYMDTLNYIISEKKIIEFFKHVYDALNSKGIFIFDIHQISNLENFDGYLESGFIDGDEYRWYSHVYDYNQGLVGHDFTFYIKGKVYEEKHVQQILTKENYERLFQNYFTILKIEQDEYRVYYTLQKRSYHA